MTGELSFSGRSLLFRQLLGSTRTTRAFSNRFVLIRRSYSLLRTVAPQPVSCPTTHQHAQLPNAGCATQTASDLSRSASSGSVEDPDPRTGKDIRTMVRLGVEVCQDAVSGRPTLPKSVITIRRRGPIRTHFWPTYAFCDRIPILRGTQTRLSLPCP